MYKWGDLVSNLHHGLRHLTYLHWPVHWPNVLAPASFSIFPSSPNPTWPSITYWFPSTNLTPPSSPTPQKASLLPLLWSHSMFGDLFPLLPILLCFQPFFCLYLSVKQFHFLSGSELYCGWYIFFIKGYCLELYSEKEMSAYEDHWPTAALSLIIPLLDSSVCQLHRKHLIWTQP